MAQEDYDRGYSDAKDGNGFNPPEGNGWDAAIARSCDNASEADQDYRDGYEAGKGA